MMISAATARAEGQEWLEPDGLGGYASGTVSGIRTRRYHALLTAASTPPTGRVVLVAAVEVSLETEGGAAVPLSTHRYAPDVLHPDGLERLHAFSAEPCPTWTYVLDDGDQVVFSVLAPRGTGDVHLEWRLEGSPRSGARSLLVRPLLAGRDAHFALREWDGFGFDPVVVGGNVAWRPRPGVPPVSVLTNGGYRHEPLWFRQFVLVEERARGLEDIEDLASPGVFRIPLAPDRPAVAILRAGESLLGDAEAIHATVAPTERRRRAALSPDQRRVEAYLVRRGRGRTLVAGYPWFTDWGRDTFIALRGLCLSTGRLAEAAEILEAWSESVTDGLVPNRFPEGAAAPELNTADASLWFVIATGELLARLGERSEAGRNGGARWRSAVAAIIDGHVRGTHYGIGIDADGLLRAGRPGTQLTWMDAKIGDRVITPRVGKPVELQALWVNALAVAERLLPSRAVELGARRAATLARFGERFVRTDGRMADVVDVDHVPGTADFTLRPNALLAVGGLPIALVDRATARAVVDEIERQLYTPHGLRTLDPRDPAYRGRYLGGPVERDEAYHQGTAWPWLLGPFVEAWLSTRTPAERAGGAHALEAELRFLRPLARLAEATGSGHLPELADGDAPHRPGGAPFQAWSLGEWIRARELVERARTDARSTAFAPAL